MNWREKFVGLRKWQEAEKEKWKKPQAVCDHMTQAVRAYKTAAGGVQYVQQCLTCGSKQSTPIAQNKVQGSPPPFDVTLAGRYRQSQDLGMNYEELRAGYRRQWFDLYDAYLNSLEWQAKRQAALDLSGGVCQGCRQSPPFQVHHLTYRHVGSELLFELVALCERCHEIAHDDKEDEDDDN